ncbi:response regulator [Elusimicrobiota bacterium]
MDIKKILVVDDEMSIRRFFDLILKDKYEITVSESGKDAVKKMSKKEFDVVFIDVVMPDMDGIETLNAIMAIKPNIVAVMITGYAVKEDIEQAISMGAIDFIYKPFRKEDIVAVLDKIAAKESVEELKKEDISSIMLDMENKEKLKTPTDEYLERRNRRIIPLVPMNEGIQIKYAVMLSLVLIGLLMISQIYTYMTLESILPAILSTQIGEKIAGLQSYLMVFGIVYIAVIAFISFYVTHRLVGPVYRVTRELLQLSRSPVLSFRFKVRSNDEFKTLPEYLNKMMEKLEKTYADPENKEKQ